MRTPLTLARLLSELRELPDGLATPVRADYLVADVLEALGHTALSNTDAQDAPSGAVAVLR
jgi:hypothetical protein